MLIGMCMATVGVLVAGWTQERLDAGGWASFASPSAK